MEVDDYTPHSSDEWFDLIVNQKKATLLQFIKSKRDGLVGDFPDEREEALRDIVNVIKKFPNDFLEKDEVSYLLEFLLARIDSSALAGGAVIDGIHHLMLHSINLPDHFEETLIRFMFKEGNVQSWSQNERKLQYEILQWLLNNRFSLLKAMGMDFIASFLKSISGERDPRCLVKMFSIFLQVSRNFDLGPLVEEYFETVACYFPVQFKPSTNDTITRNYLATLCASCLVSSSSFASFCYLLIDEKLNDEECSDEEIEDVLNLIILACQNFPPKSISFYLNELLGGIRMIALNPKNHQKLSPNLTKSLKSIILTSQKVPVSDGCKDKVISDIFLENLEPFVLQAEMGLCDKSLILLKCAYLHLIDEYASKVWKQTVMWIITLVQGDSVNVAANKIEIVSESLKCLIEWVELAIQKPLSEKNLTFFESNIIDSCEASREFCPKEGLSAKYLCASIYLEHKYASDELIDKSRTMVANSLRTVTFDKELEALSKLETALSVSNLNQIKIILQDNSFEEWNHNKILPFLCSVCHSEESWNLVKYSIENQLSKKLESKNLEFFVEMCRRCKTSEALIWEQIELLDKIVLNSKEIPENVGFFIQQILCFLSEKCHEKYTNILFKRFMANENNSDYMDQRFGLALLQNKNLDELRQIINLKLSAKVYQKFLFASVNREAITCSSLEQEDFNNLSIAFTKVKGLLLSDTVKALPLFVSLLEYISTLEKSEVYDNLYRYLLDFTSFECDPDKCQYNTGSILWRQRIFFMIVPVYIRTFENVGKNNSNLIGLLSPLLEFAQFLGNVQIKTQFAMLLPLLVKALNQIPSGNRIPETVIRAIPTIISVSESLQQKDVELFIFKLCDSIKLSSSSMINILYALDGLKSLARHQPSRILYPSISTVTTTLSSLLGHKKRVVRQKSADVKNIWEMLVTK